MNLEKQMLRELRLIRMSLSVIAFSLRKISGIEDAETEDSGVEDDLPY